MEKCLILYVDRKGKLRYKSYFGAKYLVGVGLSDPEDWKIPPRGLNDFDLEFIWQTSAY